MFNTRLNTTASCTTKPTILAQSSHRDFIRSNIPKHYARRATRSDFWEPYAIVFPARTHRCCGKEEGATNHVERWFCTLRQRVGRLVRKTLSFSRSVERHADAIHLFITTYNLRIQQQAAPC